MDPTEGMKSWQRKLHGLSAAITGICFGYSSLMLLPSVGDYLQDHHYISAVFYLVGSLTLFVGWVAVAEVCRHAQTQREFWQSLANSLLGLFGILAYIYSSYLFVDEEYTMDFYGNFWIGSIIMFASQLWKTGALYFSRSDKTRSQAWKQTYFWTQLTMLIAVTCYLIGFRVLASNGKNSIGLGIVNIGGLSFLMNAFLVNKYHFCDRARREIGRADTFGEPSRSYEMSEQVSDII